MLKKYPRVYWTNFNKIELFKKKENYQLIKALFIRFTNPGPSYTKPV